jgi:hypothetical protein
MAILELRHGCSRYPHSGYSATPFIYPCITIVNFRERSNPHGERADGAEKPAIYNIREIRRKAENSAK